MKILFVPYYYYLNYNSFLSVIRELCNVNIEAFILHMPCSPIDESSIYNQQRFEEDGCPYISLELCKAGLSGESLIRRTSRVFRFFINKLRIKRFLIKEKPDKIVLGSDLGGVYIRVIQDYCQSMDIPIIIIYYLPFVGVGASINQPRLLTYLLQLIKIDRTVFFASNVVGSYTHNSIVMIPGQTMKEKLITLGISSERIIITGNPAHDYLFYLKLKRETSRTRLFKKWNIPKGRKVIVYCTEVIQDIYGNSYLNNINSIICKEIHKVFPEVIFIVKLHPKEPEEVREYYRRMFGEKYLILTNEDINELLNSADIIIGHFSNTLIDSMVLGRLIISINYKKDSIGFLTPEEEMIIAHSEQELHSKLHLMLHNEAFQYKALNVIQKWVDRNAFKIDGLSSKRVANALLEKPSENIN